MLYVYIVGNTARDRYNFLGELLSLLRFVVGSEQHTSPEKGNFATLKSTYSFKSSTVVVDVFMLHFLPPFVSFRSYTQSNLIPSILFPSLATSLTDPFDNHQKISQSEAEKSKGKRKIGFSSFDESIGKRNGCQKTHRQAMASGNIY